MMRRFRSAIALLVALLSSAGTREQRLDPTIILVGLDGFRFDYALRGETPNLDRLASRGVRAKRLIPPFPTTTFPSFYTVATGLHPESHGIVANTMYDPVFRAWFRIRDTSAVRDGRWWGGEPIWVTAETQGQTAATFFLPGTEAPVEGVRPTYWKRFDRAIPTGERVAEILRWLDLPARERPTFVTLYLGEVDAVAHDYNPDWAPEVAAAVRRVDATLGSLLTGLEERGLLDQINIIVVSDHGMAATSPDRVIFVDDYVDLDRANVVDWSPVLALRPPEEDLDEVYEALAGAHPHLRVFRKRELPERLHYRSHRRIAPIIGIADEGWSISNRRYYARNRDRFKGGTHGYDNALPSMAGVLVAAGPAFERGIVTPPIHSVHLYSLMCHVLGLQPAPNEGSLDSVRLLLRR